jgi:hypothetical protein
MAEYFRWEDKGDTFIAPFKYYYIVFRKNSSQKTMNSTFLSRVFNSKQFVEDYK